MATRHAKCPGPHHKHRQAERANAEQVRLPLAPALEDHLALKDQRHNQVGDRHEGKCGARSNRAMEMAGHIERVVHQ